MGRFVIAAYKPRAGKEALLLAAVEKHMRILRAEGLVTDRPAYVMRAADGTLVEVFEWRSRDAIEEAHKNAAVNALWAELGAVSEYTPLAKLPESSNLFAEFEPVSF